MLAKLIRLYRAVENISLRVLAKQIGISASTLSRVERGYECDQTTMLFLIRWLFEGAKKDSNQALAELEKGEKGGGNDLG